MQTLDLNFLQTAKTAKTVTFSHPKDAQVYVTKEFANDQSIEGSILEKNLNRLGICSDRLRQKAKKRMR